MEMKKVASVDSLSGLLFITLGLLGTFLSLKESIGTPARMGPGFMPLLLSVGLATLGAVILVRGLRSTVSTEWRFGIRPLFMVLASVAVFAACIRSVGFAPAVFTSVVIASYAEKTRSLVSALLLAFVISTFCSLIFVIGLGLTIPVFSLPWRF
jgi:hypothetical protein